MRLLCLDLATTAGYCFGNEAGVQAHGSFALPMTGGNYGWYLLAYRRWLFTAIDRWQPDRIVYESPILPKAGNIHTLRKLYSLGPRTEEIAADNAIKVGEANLSDIRRHFIGTDRAPKTVAKKDRREWIKGRIVTECRNHGFRPVDDNAADAIALFSFDMTASYPGFVLAGDEIARAA